MKAPCNPDDRKTVLAIKNNKYSFMDFTNQSLINADDISNSVIIGSCFSQSVGLDDEVPVKVFPSKMREVLFVECNLDNVEIPLGNMVAKSCSTNLIQPQNDGLDWLLDKDKKPKVFRDQKYLGVKRHNMNPSRIPKIRPTPDEFRLLKHKIKMDMIDSLREL